HVTLLLTLHLPPAPPSSTLSLHDALPISCAVGANPCRARPAAASPVVPGSVRADPVRRRSNSIAAASGPGCRSCAERSRPWRRRDRKSTRLNSSHVSISYAVFCLEKKTKL